MSEGCGVVCGEVAHVHRKVFVVLKFEWRVFTKYVTMYIALKFDLESYVTMYIALSGIMLLFT